MKVGYVRDSGGHASVVDDQRKALTLAKCEKLFSDSPATKGTGLVEAIAQLKAGDALIVTKLDRLGKPIKAVIDLINTIESRGATFAALDDAVDTGTPDGRYLTKVLTNLASMDKSLSSERTQRSLRIAKEKGRAGGRPPALSVDQINEAKKLIDSGMPVRAVAKLIGSNHATLYRHIGAKPADLKKSG